MVKKIILIILVVVIAGLITVFSLFWFKRPKLDAPHRKNAPYSFADIEQGKTHYQSAGDTASETVLLIHGATIPLIVWEPTVAPLKEAGYRVIRYDLYGRGYSERLDTEFTYDTYIDQIANLLNFCGARLPVHVVGLSLGGALAVLFAEAHPEMVKSLTMISPAGPYIHNRDFKDRWSRIKKACRAICGSQDSLDIKRNELLEPLMKAARRQLRFRGTLEVSVSFMKNRDPERLKKAFRHAGELEIPKLLVWGKKDPVLDMKYSENVLSFIPDAQYVEFETTGHLSHYEAPEKFNKLLLDFLEKAAADHNPDI